MLGPILDTLNIDLKIWAILLIAAWYIRRGGKMGKKTGSVLSRALTDIMLILVTLAVAAFLGWADLHVGAILSDAGTAAGWLMNEGRIMIQNALEGVIG